MLRESRYCISGFLFLKRDPRRPGRTFSVTKDKPKLLKYPDVNSSYSIAGDTFETGYQTLREINVYPRRPRGNTDYSGGDDRDPLRIISIVLVIIFATMVIGLLVRFFRRRSPQPTGDIPLTTTALPGVHREDHGEDGFQSTGYRTRTPLTCLNIET